MDESDTYLAILDEGQMKYAQRAILFMAEPKCGSPPEEVKSRLKSITDLERLDRMLRRAPEAVHWDDILDTP